MLYNILHKFMNLKIRYKILLSLVFVSFLTATIISLASYQFYKQYALDQATYEIEKSISVVTESLNNDFNKLYFDISYFLLEDRVMENIMQHIREGDTSSYIEDYLKTQPLFETTMRNNPLIKSMILLGQNGEFYSTLNVGLNHKYENNLLFDEEEVKSMSWYGVKKNPLSNDKDYIIPIVFPLKKDYFSTFSFYLSEIEDSTANLYVFIDVNKLDQDITQMNKNAASKLILYNNENNPISLNPSSSYYKLSLDPQVIEFIATDSSKNIINVIINNQSYMLTKSTFGINGFTIVNFISTTKLLKPLQALRIQTTLLFWVSIVISIFISFIVSRSVTKPLKKLMVLVNQISNGNYITSEHYDYDDEIGQLRRSLNEMSTLINRQISIIKEQEKNYANAEIDILTEQINPHFLYNTLDYIHWEILAKNTSGASSMVDNLSQYLRLGLNRGSRLITIESEIKRIKEYLNIINHRQNSNICLETIINPENLSLEILILILQPIIENCVKHAFDETTRLIIANPTIRITFTIESDAIIIQVEDNGKGMDIEKMQKLILQNQTYASKHVGLKNVYLRIMAYYGKLSKMEFESTPFYRNVVTLMLKRLS